MSDSKQIFNAVKNTIKNILPQEPKGNAARHFNTLCALISGIIRSRSSQLPKIAANTSSDIKLESQEKKYSRLLQNKAITHNACFLPFIVEILKFLGLKTYYIAIDGSTVGDGCITLMASLYYKGRAIPLTWITIVGKKGHFPEYLHIQLIEQLTLILPENADVVVTGDGEFDGVGFVQVIEDYQWEYVVRTANNTIIKTFDGDEYNFVELTPKKGRSIIISDILFTEEEHYIQSAVVWWRKDCKTPLFLISNIDKKSEIMSTYRKRFSIETLFSDKKTRGFNIHKSHVYIIPRLDRLLVAVSISYIWIIYLGLHCISEGIYKRVTRSSRRDLSLFQLGYRALEYCLANEIKFVLEINFENCGA